MYALRYAAGYVPRALKNKLEKCKSKNKDILDCIDDMLTLMTLYNVIQLIGLTALIEEAGHL